MKKWVLIILGMILLWLVLFDDIAVKASICIPDKELKKALTGEGHKETQVGIGVVPQGNLLVLYVNEVTRTWTVVMFIPMDKLGCMLASGDGWEFYTDTPEKNSH